MGGGLVAAVGRQLLAQEGGQILVRDDVLQRCDVQPPRGLTMLKFKDIQISQGAHLEYCLIGPLRVLSLNSPGQHVVPAIEEQPKGQQGGVLVGAGVPQQVQPAGVRLPLQPSNTTQIMQGQASTWMCGAGKLWSGTPWVLRGG